MKTVTLRGRYLIKAPKEKVYKIITDFEQSTKLFPDVAKSIKIIEQNGQQLKIEAVTKPFKFSKAYVVSMVTQLNPPNGFSSINTSLVGIEDETVRLETTKEGTIFDYKNTMKITNKLYRPIANLLIKKLALKFWEKKYIIPLKNLLEE